MKLVDIFNKLPCSLYSGSFEENVNGICVDSRFAAPNNLFIARPGELYPNQDEFIEEAVSSGVSAVLTQSPHPFLKHVTQIVCDDIASLEPIIAQRFYENPSKDIFLVGVTGTNGKTTISYLIKHIFDFLSDNCGLIGTLEYVCKNRSIASSLTTPGVILNNKYIRDMVKEKCNIAVMEVSSIGIDKNRIGLLDFDVALLSQITQDHLDYHLSLDSYAKRKVDFLVSNKNNCIVNIDSEYSELVLQKSKAKNKFSYGINKPADLMAVNICLTSDGTTFDLFYKSSVYKVKTKLLAKFNVYNILAAISVVMLKGYSLSEIIPLISSFNPPSGRLELVRRDDLKVYIDYAHTPDALENICKSVKEIHSNETITLVFGCGGDRDKTKRPLMGNIAVSYADKVVITNDNPRTEDPYNICNDILNGMNKDKVIVELDRKKAIFLAMSSLKKGVVIVAGRGHETKQLFKGRYIFFNDKLCVEQCFEEIGILENV